MIKMHNIYPWSFQKVRPSIYLWCARKKKIRNEAQRRIRGGFIFKKILLKRYGFYTKIQIKSYLTPIILGEDRVLCHVFKLNNSKKNSPIDTTNEYFCKIEFSLLWKGQTVYRSELNAIKLVHCSKRGCVISIN